MAEPDGTVLRVKLAKIEALFQRAGSFSERAAAAAGMERLKSRPHDDNGQVVEMKFSVPDPGSAPPNRSKAQAERLTAPDKLRSSSSAPLAIGPSQRPFRRHGSRRK